MQAMMTSIDCMENAASICKHCVSDSSELCDRTETYTNATNIRIDGIVRSAVAERGINLLCNTWAILGLVRLISSFTHQIERRLRPAIANKRVIVLSSHPQV